MEELNLDDVRAYVNENIVDFHQRRIKSLEDLTLSKLLKKNPYLFKAKNITTASQLIEGLLEAFLSSSEEKLFGDFLPLFMPPFGVNLADFLQLFGVKRERTINPFTH